MPHLQLLGSVDLRDDLGVQLRQVPAQPKRLALLAYLVLGDGKTRQRDVILALFWPELDTARARSALRQALHYLRRELGDGAIITEGESLATDPATLKCDVAEFLAHVAAGDDAAALTRYGGDLLDGVHVSDASVEWESWLDAERSRLRDTALTVTRRLIAAAHVRGDFANAITYSRRACQLAPDDDAMARALVAALIAAGDHAGALRVHDAFARRRRREYEMDVSPEMAALVASIRREPRELEEAVEPVDPAGELIQAATAATPRTTATATAATATATATATTPMTATVGMPRRRHWRVIAGAAFGVAVILATIAGYGASHASEPTVLAVGMIRDHTGSPELAAAVGELLATDLARAAGSRVISTPRIYELVAELDSSMGERQRLSRAARVAGAQEFLEGALYRDSTGLRFEMERVDVVTGRVVSVRTIVGIDPFVLAERATESVLGTMHLERAGGNLRDVVASSPMALRFYQEGMRARAQNDRDAARRFFAAAVAEDSSFAMATFELAMFEGQVGPLHLRALQLAARTSDRERLLIQATLAQLLDDPATRAFAETLTVRYPSEPEGPLMLGRALILEGRFADAIAPLRRVIVMDSLSLRGGDACRACDAYSEIVSAYLRMDSIPAAERVAHEFVNLQPSRASARYALMDVFDYEQRFDESRRIVAEIEAASGRSLGEYSQRGEVLIREGRLDEAEAYLQRIISTANADDRANARWTYTILLRTQGRFREALAIADELRTRGTAPPAPPAQKYWNGGMRAMILHDMGRYKEAIALRDSSRRTPFGFTASRRARSAASELSHVAAAYAALGDTAALRVIADEIEALGRRTGSGMQQRLHHYVRGLRFGLLGEHDAAVRELRMSIYTLNGGFVRENYELGRALLAAGRPAEAVYVIDAALRGPVGAGSISVTRPTLEMVKARAQEKLGDSTAAIASYSRAVAAWEHADRSVTGERTKAAARIRALSR